MKNVGRYGKVVLGEASSVESAQVTMPRAAAVSVSVFISRFVFWWYQCLPGDFRPLWWWTLWSQDLSTFFYTNEFAADILVPWGLWAQLYDHLPVQEPAALWRSQCCVLCGHVHCYSQCQLWGADCIWHQAGDSEVEWEEPWWVQVEDWEREEWEEEEEDGSDAESVAATVRALKTISAATIIANSAGQGASGRGGSQHSLFWDGLGGVVVATRSILCCLCFYLFLCEALTPQLPPTIMEGAWVCRGLRLHAACVHSFKWCFAFFCFLVFVTAISQAIMTRHRGACGGFTLQAATAIGTITLFECISCKTTTSGYHSFFPHLSGEGC